MFLGIQQTSLHMYPYTCIQHVDTSLEYIPKSELAESKASMHLWNIA